MDAWLNTLGGRFIVFDGPDGSGKTTQLKRFVAACRDADAMVEELREPGGTAIGERIRDLLLSHGEEDIDPVCEMLLYMASRAQLVACRIEPLLEQGFLVVADRFVSSTLAYQGAAGGVPEEHIYQVAEIVCDKIRPDLVVLFDVDEVTAGRRLSPLLDRMEAKGRAFHARVRKGYLDQAQRDPDRHLVIDASQPPDKVFEDLMLGVRERLCDDGGPGA
ncbi:MAG: dTMP kinase [Phycisphaerales bacterium]|nr:MAG: dTMP kinase [Phycisphaerales bacterium]